jgi:hypothetical protein
MKTHQTSLRRLTLVVSLAGALASHAAPVSSSFTYQGQLKNNGVPVNTPRDFRVTMYDRASSATGVGQIGNPNQLSCQAVVNGLFTLTLNFGDTRLTIARRVPILWEADPDKP